MASLIYLSQISILHSWYQISHQILLILCLKYFFNPSLSHLSLYHCPASHHRNRSSVLSEVTLLIVPIQSYLLPTNLSTVAWEMSILPHYIQVNAPYCHRVNSHLHSMVYKKAMIWTLHSFMASLLCSSNTEWLLLTQPAVQWFSFFSL